MDKQQALLYSTRNYIQHPVINHNEKKAYVYSESESRSVVPDSLRPHVVYSPWNSLGQNTGVGSLSLLHGIFPTQESNPGLLHCRQILPAEPQGKSKNTGGGSLSLLQRIFLTQESNWGLLHCRWILYQLNYEGSPYVCVCVCVCVSVYSIEWNQFFYAAQINIVNQPYFNKML